MKLFIKTSLILFLLLLAFLVILWLTIYFEEVNCNDYNIGEYLSPFNKASIRVYGKKCINKNDVINVFLSDDNEHYLVLSLIKDNNAIPGNPINIKWVSEKKITIQVEKGFEETLTIGKAGIYKINYSYKDGRKGKEEDNFPDVKASLSEAEVNNLIKIYVENKKDANKKMHNLTKPRFVTLTSEINGFAKEGDLVWDVRVLCESGEINSVYIIKDETGEIFPFVERGDAIKG